VLMLPGGAACATTSVCSSSSGSDGSMRVACKEVKLRSLSSSVAQSLSLDVLCDGGADPSSAACRLVCS
jgi:hypothetical protein